MKREYTLLIIGFLVACLKWIGLTNSLEQKIFTLIGLWLIYIAYKYRSEKISGKIQANKQIKQSDTQPIPEPDVNLGTSANLENTPLKENQYERKQPKPRI